MQLNSGVKSVPCVHYIDNRCKFNAEECKYSHEEKHLNVKQRKQYMESRLLEDISEEEDEEYFKSSNHGAKYEARADRSRQPTSKRRRMTESSDGSEASFNSCATRYFPEPVPAVRRRSSTMETPRRRNHSDSGNGQGARTRRSSQVTPTRRGGPRRGRRGSSGQRRSRSRSPASRRSYQRSPSPMTQKPPKGARGRSMDNKRRSGRR